MKLQTQWFGETISISSGMFVLGLIVVTALVVTLVVTPATQADTPTVITLTSGTTWTVPSDWNSTQNTIEAIGAGGKGADDAAGSIVARAGGGGGEYRKAVNIALTPSSSVTIQVAAGASGNDTFLQNNASADVVRAKPGGNGSGGTSGAGGTGGTGAAGNANGGAGGSGATAANCMAGAGGGGAGGPSGAGKAGGSSTSATSPDAGASGGGANGGSSTVGAASDSNTIGKTGGNGTGGTGGGGGGTGSQAGQVGTLGGGGGGGAGDVAAFFMGGGGGTDTAFDATHGASGGGGGGGCQGVGSPSGNGGPGGTYGGGGGGGGHTNTGSPHGTGGTGGQGLIVITYTPYTNGPTPDPMTFSSAPVAADTSSISMIATTATENVLPPVEYYFGYFSCGSNDGTGGSSSGWQSSAFYTDTGLQAGKCYGYKVKARNAIGNETAYSTLATADTMSPPVPPPAGSVPVTGYAWSDTIGWIDLNCSNLNMCSTKDFGLSIAPDGTFWGYGWSDNIGWISAYSTDVSGCPSSPCVAQVQSNGDITGWFKGTSADGNGWDGWISLNGSNYGIAVVLGNFSGYGWGSTVVGWVDFSLANTIYHTCTPTYSCSMDTIRYSDESCNVSNVTTCVSPAFCSSGSSVCLYPPPSFIQSGGGLTGHLQVVPTMVRAGSRTNVTWNVDNVSGCSVSGDNGDSWTGTSGANTSSPIVSHTVYTLSCTGLNNSTVYENAAVNIIPTFLER